MSARAAADEPVSVSVQAHVSQIDAAISVDLPLKSHAEIASKCQAC